MVLALKRDVSAVLAERLPTVMIVGGGFSGTVLAVHLLRRGGVRVILVGEHFGRGLAYSTGCSKHLLNVPAGKMSAFVDAPSHFLDWCCSKTPTEAKTFVERQRYGAYLEHLLAEAKNNQLIRLQGQVIDAIPLRMGGFDVRLADGRQHRCDRLVLALGNALPGNPAVKFGDCAYLDPRYVRNPWSHSAVTELDAAQSVLLLGSGLTMVDKMLELRAAGFTGQILSLSRRGLLPTGHQSETGSFVFEAADLPCNIRALCRLVRQTAAEQTNWRAVVDALRPHTIALWQALPMGERRRFLRHLRPYWEVLRHRVAPAIYAVLEKELANKTLNVQAGRLLGYAQAPQGLDVYWQPRSSQAQAVMRVQRIINCTGPQSCPQKMDNPLLASLYSRKLLRTDALNLGLDADAQGGLIDTQGNASDQLFALGTLLRGQRLESNAVPELRLQAEQLATRLCPLQVRS